MSFTDFIYGFHIKDVDREYAENLIRYVFFFSFLWKELQMFSQNNHHNM
jgi:hypothetical protein